MTKQLETTSAGNVDNDALNKQKMENKRLKKAVKDLEEELNKLKANSSSTTVINKGKGSEACIIS